MLSSTDSSPALSAAIIGVLGLSAPAAASEATANGRGADLLPVAATPLRLLSQDVALELVPVRDAWAVLATYVIENPTDQVVKLRLIFPEQRCDPVLDCSPMAGQFQDLSTRVRGEPVEPTEASPGELGVRDTHAWGDAIGRIFVYDLQFQPRERVTVVHSYLYDRSGGVDWWGTDLLTRSAGLWAGPVGRARFTVRLPSPALYVIYPRALPLVRFVEEARADGAGSRTELVFEAVDWAADEDFSVRFPSFSVTAMGPEGLCVGMDGDLSDEELVGVLEGWSDAQLRACRNGLYGLHGYPFKDEALHAAHYGAPPALPDWADPARLAIAPRPMNPGFQVTVFSAGEQAWVNAIAAEEQRRGSR